MLPNVVVSRSISPCIPIHRRDSHSSNRKKQLKSNMHMKSTFCVILEQAQASVTRRPQLL
jgi:hypothetical protein